MSKGNARVHIGLGAPSIFMVFAILCFTILAILSYISAENQKTQANLYEHNVQEIYNVDMQGDKVRKEIDEILNTSTNLDYETNIIAYCNALGYVFDHDQQTITFVLKTKRKVLHGCIRIDMQRDTSKRTVVETWKIESIREEKQ